MKPEQIALLTGGMDQLPGWPLRPVVSWLLQSAAELGQPVELVSGLCARLTEVGAPLKRVRAGINVLHPEVVGCSYTWWRDQGVVEEESALHGVTNTSAYIGSPMEKLHQGRESVHYPLYALADDGLHSSLRELKEAGCTDYVGFPVVFTNGRVQSLLFATDAAGGFDDHDLAKLALVKDLLAPYWEIIARQQLCDSLLSTYIGPRIAKRVMNGQIKRGDMELIEAALWFSDLRSFTSLSEHLSAQTLLDSLNTYFETVAVEVTARGGEILRFIGDAMLIVFPVSAQVSLAQAADQALAAAQATLQRMDGINQQRAEERMPPLLFGLGLHVGSVQYGNVGAPNRLDFTVMGPAVNRTARIEDMTKLLQQPVLISAEMAGLLERPLQQMGSHELRGVDEPVTLFAPLPAEPALPHSAT
ncbi:adenylate/guanylate cyclase domain-containing protein [Pokkaliibacter plantistimulans]|uniref:Adenylate/guanylate cyclase domain-containing protein n=1 Tax=Proteobacteria bacterium 228 TaxID=2083153 RepID=A0A2S5KW45_9PROT|nr:adenylate/guanylate cyclase domain-containing protein [Pokkaliibacter plantistimulans]PPC78938.1 adenylate/guanylate cyclase domain-containing protein [Pokkaliibacter plantistimulans]